MISLISPTQVIQLARAYWLHTNREIVLTLSKRVTPLTFYKQVNK